jgi:hypothetical protein
MGPFVQLPLIAGATASCRPRPLPRIDLRYFEPRCLEGWWSLFVYLHARLSLCWIAAIWL